MISCGIKLIKAYSLDIESESEDIISGFYSIKIPLFITKLCIK